MPTDRAQEALTKAQALLDKLQIFVNSAESELWNQLPRGFQEALVFQRQDVARAILEALEDA